MDVVGLIAGAVGGLAAGKGADSSPAIPSPGGVATLASGGIGGILGSLATSGIAGDLGSTVANAAGQLVGGGVAGLIVTAIVGAIFKKKS